MTCGMKFPRDAESLAEQTLRCAGRVKESLFMDNGDNWRYFWPLFDENDDLRALVRAQYLTETEKLEPLA